MKRFVVDASVAMKWFIPEVHAPAAIRLLDEQVRLSAPDLLLPELGNTLWKKIRRKELSVQEATEVARAVELMTVEIVSSKLLLSGALELATALKRTVYDSLYLALAFAQNCQLVTADHKLYSALSSTAFAPHIAWVEDEL